MKKPTFEIENENEIGEENDIENQDISESTKEKKFETIPVFEERVKSEIKDVEEKSKSYFLFLKKIFDEKDNLKKFEDALRLESGEYLNGLDLEELDTQYQNDIQIISSLSTEHYVLMEEFSAAKSKKRITEDNILSNFLNIQDIYNNYSKNYKDILSLKDRISKTKSRVLELMSEELGLDNVDEDALSPTLSEKIQSKREEIKKVKGFMGIGKFSNKSKLQSLTEELERLEFCKKIYSRTFNFFHNSSISIINDYGYEGLLKQCNSVIKYKFKKIGNDLKDSEKDFRPIISTETINNVTQEKIDAYILERFDDLAKKEDITPDYLEESKNDLINLGKRILSYIEIEREAQRVTVEGLDSEEKRNEYKEFNELLHKLPRPLRDTMINIIKNNSTPSELNSFDTLNSIKTVYDLYNKNLISDSVLRIKDSCQNMLGTPLSSYDDREWSEMGIEVNKDNIERMNYKNVESMKKLFPSLDNNIFFDEVILRSESSVLKVRFGGDFDIRLKDIMAKIVEYKYLSNKSVEWEEFKYFIDRDNAAVFIITQIINNFKNYAHNNFFILKEFFSDFDGIKDMDSLTTEALDMVKDEDSGKPNEKMGVLVDKLFAQDPKKNIYLTIRYWQDALSYSEFIEKIVKNKDVFMNLDSGLGGTGVVSAIVSKFLSTWVKDESINMEMFELLKSWQDKYLFNIDDWYKNFVDIILKDKSIFSEEFLIKISKLLRVEVEEINNPGISLAKYLINNNIYKVVFDHMDKFTNEDFSHNELISIILESRNNSDKLKDILQKNIDKFKNLNLESYNKLIKIDIDLCLNNITIFKEVPEDLTVFKKVFQHSFNSMIYSYLKPIFDTGELPEELVKIGITKKGEEGVIQARDMLKESVFNLFSDDSSNWENIIESDLMMNYLSTYVKYADSQFGQHDLTSFKKILTTYQEEQKIGEIMPVPEYIKPQTIELKKIKDGVIPWTRSAFDRFEIIMDSYRKANSVFGQERKPLTKIVQQIEEYRKSAIDDLEEKLKTIEKPEAKIGIQKKIDNIKSLKFRSIEDFFTNIVALNKDPDTHDFLRQILFLITLWKRPETQVSYFGDTSLDINNATKLDEFVSHILNQEVFGSIYDKQESKSSNKLPKKSEVLKAIKNIMNNHAINVELDQFMNKQNSNEKIEIELIPSRGPIMEFSGHIASACWASKYKSMVAMFPNITSVIFKEKLDKESSKLSGAFLLIESVDVDNNKVLIIRGLNPLDSLLNKVDIDDFYEKIKNYVSETAKNDDRTPLIVIDDHSGGSSTNRPRLYSLLKSVDVKPSKLTKLGKPEEIKTKTSTYSYSEKEYRGGHTFNGYDIEDVCYRV